MADPTQLVPPLFYVFSASVAALVSRVLTHPLDTLRVRAQSETEYHPKRSPTTLLALLRNVIVNEGFSALYRGITVVLIFSVPALITYIGTYDTSKPIIAGILRLDVTSAWVHLLCGAIAEIASAVFWTPMEVIKSRQQVVLNDFGQSESVVVVTKRLIQQEGYSGLFKGYLLGVGVYVPQSITYFVVYEQLKMAFAAVLFPGVYPLPTATLPSWAVLISATIASAAGGAVSNVVDVVKTRVQISTSLTLPLRQDSSTVAPSTISSSLSGSDQSLLRSSTTIFSSHERRFIESADNDDEDALHNAAGRANRRPVTLWEYVRSMWEEEGGPLAFFRGVTARVAWVVPSATLFFVIDEGLKAWYIRTHQ